MRTKMASEKCAKTVIAIRSSDGAITVSIEQTLIRKMGTIMGSEMPVKTQIETVSSMLSIIVREYRIRISMIRTMTISEICAMRKMIA